MKHWIFNELGSIPGIPGTFANCRVDVMEDGSIMVWPLHSDFTPTVTPVEQPVEPVAPPAEQAVPVTATEIVTTGYETAPTISDSGLTTSDIVQGQVSQPVPYFTGG